MRSRRAASGEHFLRRGRPDNDAVVGEFRDGNRRLLPLRQHRNGQLAALERRLRFRHRLAALSDGYGRHAEHQAQREGRVDRVSGSRCIMVEPSGKIEQARSMCKSGSSVSAELADVRAEITRLRMWLRLDSLVLDAKYGVRQLARAPLVTSVAVRDAGHRHRPEHRGLQPRPRGAPASPSLPGRRAARVDRAAPRPAIRHGHLGVAGRLPDLEAAEPPVRRDDGLRHRRSQPRRRRPGQPGADRLDRRRLLGDDGCPAGARSPHGRTTTSRGLCCRTGCSSGGSADGRGDRPGGRDRRGAVHHRRRAA